MTAVGKLLYIGVISDRDILLLVIRSHHLLWVFSLTEEPVAQPNVLEMFRSPV